MTRRQSQWPRVTVLEFREPCYPRRIAHSAHGAGRSEEDLYSGLSALEAARKGAGGRRRPPRDVISLMLRTQDFAELPPDELGQRITLKWRHVGVMLLHLRSAQPGIGPLELPGQWRPGTVQHLQDTGGRSRTYNLKRNITSCVRCCRTVPLSAGAAAQTLRSPFKQRRGASRGTR